MSKSDENGPLDWLMMIPLTAIFCVAAVVFGVAHMIAWATRTVIKGVARVRHQ